MICTQLFIILIFKLPREHLPWVKNNNCYHVGHYTAFQFGLNKGELCSADEEPDL